MDQRKRKDHFCKKLDQIIRGQNKRLRKNNDDDKNNNNNSNGGNNNNNNNDNNGGSNNNDSNESSGNDNVIIKRWVPNKKITDQLNHIETKLDTLSGELSEIRELNNKILEILLTLKERPSDVDEYFIADVVKQTAKLIMEVKIYPEKAEIRGAVESYLKSNHEKFYIEFSEHRWTSFYNEFIHKKLLKQIRSLRGSLAAKTRDALFATFGEVSLPPINTNASPIEISEWKKKPEVENCYKKLFINSNNKEEEPLILTRIVQRVFKKKCSTNEMSFVVAVCSYVLNPKYQNLKLKEKTIKRKVKIYSKKIEAKMPLLDEETGDENENVSESESESEDED